MARSTVGLIREVQDHVSEKNEMFKLLGFLSKEAKNYLLYEIEELIT
ncbi:MAG: hypothetical protein AAF600_22340 [Bacteroidota bacterium]